MIARTFFAVMLLAFAVNCDKVEEMAQGLPTPPPETTTPVSVLTPLELKPDAELEIQFETIAEDARGTVGAAVVVLETGQAASLNANRNFAMQSVYKLPIAMAVLQQVDAEKVALDEAIGVTKDDFVRPGQRSLVRDENPNGTTLTVRELIRLSVSESDGTASDVLMRVAGGAPQVQAYLTATGIGDMAVKNLEKDFPTDWQIQYQNFATPNAAIALLRNLHEGNGISPANREMLLQFMTESPTGPNRLKGLLPKGTPVAHKTGTSGSRNGIQAATNDIGIVTLPDGRHMLIAVFVRDSAADEKTREAVIARIAKAAWDKFATVKN